MGRVCAFTICAKNYFGLAKALRQSLRTHHPEIEFVIFVADEPEGASLESVSDRVAIARTSCDISQEDWISMAFKYDLVEFCTAIKPFCMTSLFQEGYEKVLYFDPDILIFGALDSVLSALETHKVVVTPHRIDIENDMPSRGGIYNLGFIGARASRSTERMLSWWRNRLHNHCSIDPMRGYFTDQKWMDHLPVIYDNDEVFVSRDPGLNYAPWNFNERSLSARDGRFFVRLKGDGSVAPLSFAHFSAMKYKDVARGQLATTPSIRDCGVTVRDLVTAYGVAIAEAGFEDYVSLPYSYATFSNGDPIEYSHRRIYKRLREEGFTFENPFRSDGQFCNLIRAAHMFSPTTGCADRVKPEEIPSIEAKIKLIDILMSGVMWAIGYARFTMLARLMIRYLHLSNRARLLGPQFRKLKIEPF